MEVQVKAAAPRRAAAPRAPLPRDKLSQVAGSLADSPLKQALERISRDPGTRRKT